MRGLRDQRHRNRHCERPETSHGYESAPRRVHQLFAPPVVAAVGGPDNGASPAPTNVRLIPTTSRSINVVYSAFAVARSFSIIASNSRDVSVGPKSAPPATSPAPVPTSP